MKEQKFDGKVYKLYENEKYYSRGNKRLHTEVWKFYNGEIPKGCEIHHIDMNTFNNDISNLQCLTKKQHKEIHKENMTKERKEFLIKNINENARPKAIEWHKSEEGREWHKKHFEDFRDKMLVEKEFKCIQCGKKYKTFSNGLNKFCSNKCKSKYRRDNKIDHEIRKCIICGGDFETNKYSKVKTCSKNCVYELKRKLKGGN